MSNTFGLGGQFLAALAVGGVSDSDLQRIIDRGLIHEVVSGVKLVVETDRDNERMAHVERSRVLNSGIDKLERLSGVEYSLLGIEYAEMVKLLRDNNIGRIQQLTKVNLFDLQKFGLDAEVVNYLDVALQALGLRLRSLIEEQ